MSLFVFLLKMYKKKMNCYLIQKTFTCTVKYIPCCLLMLNSHWNYSNAAPFNFSSELLWCYLDCCVIFKVQLLVLALVYQQQMLYHQQMKFLWHNKILIFTDYSNNRKLKLPGLNNNCFPCGNSCCLNGTLNLLLFEWSVNRYIIVYEWNQWHTSL